MNRKLIASLMMISLLQTQIPVLFATETTNLVEAKEDGTEKSEEVITIEEQDITNTEAESTENNEQTAIEPTSEAEIMPMAEANETLDWNVETVYTMNWTPKAEPGYDYYGGKQGEYNVLPYYAEDGTIDVLLKPESGDLTVIRMDAQGNKLGEFSVDRALSQVGAYTRDAQGNCYILFGQDTREPYEVDGQTYYGSDYKQSNGNKESIRLVRYNSDFTSQESVSFTEGEVDTVLPFRSDTCAMQVKDNKVIVTYGRLIRTAPIRETDENGKEIEDGRITSYHQRSQLLILDSETLENKTIEATRPNRYWTSHSFQQDIYYQNGLWYLAERGDGSPRNFVVYTISDHTITNRWEGLAFKGKDTDDNPNLDYNNTHSLLGNIVPLGNNMCIVGSYENTTEGLELSPRNLLIQGVGDSEPTYLTTYTDISTAEVGAIKAVPLNDGKLAILYEECSYQNPERKYKNRYSKAYTKNTMHLMIIDEGYNKISDQTLPIQGKSYIPVADKIIYNDNLNAYQWITYEGNQVQLNTLKKETRTTYTINFDPTGGIVDRTTMTTDENGKVSSLPTPTKEGYNFKGWFTAVEDGEEVTTDTIFSGDTTIYAQWTKNESTYQVTFDANDGTVDTKTMQVDTNGKLATLPTPKREGYIFKGWYTEAEKGEEVTTDRVFSSDTTVYAQWTLNKPVVYNVTFDANGGTVDTSTMQVDQNGKLTSLPTPTREGYKFKGWYTEPENGEEVTIDRVFTSNTTVYAQWVQNAPTIYNVTFDANGGVVDTPTMQVEANEKLTTLPIPTREGYKFKGWYTEPENGEEITPNTIFTSDTTVYAQWTQNVAVIYNVTFDANSGVVDTPTMQVDQNGKLTSLPVPTREGYIFRGWFTAAGEIVTADTTFSSDTTLYAQWTESASVVYQVTFNANGGTVAIPTMQVNENETLATLPVPTREGYTFNGWFTEAENGEVVTIDKVYTSDTTLYAQWTQNEQPTPDDQTPDKLTPRRKSSSTMSNHYPRNPITVNASEGGTVDLNTKYVTKSTTIKITVKPNEGYVLDTIVATDKNNSTIELTKKDGIYTFLMPDSPVNLDVTFKKLG